MPTPENEASKNSNPDDSKNTNDPKSTLKDYVEKVDQFIPPSLTENSPSSAVVFSEKFERYKIKVELWKWIIGTVGLTLITYTINWGFKDREQGIKELQVYEKYASDSIVFNVNPNNRLLLAQFFANVTPSDKLKCGWKEYLKVVKIDAANFNRKLDSLRKRKIELIKEEQENPASKATKIELEETKKETDKAERINNTNLIDDRKPWDIASDFEAKGFEALLSKNLPDAIFNFNMSEGSYHGYHSSYDIARYLKSIQSTLVNDDKSWIKIYNHVLTTFGWKMSPVIKAKLIAAMGR